jgi:hypothetical protein
MKRSAAAEISFMMIGAEAKSGMNMRGCKSRSFQNINRLNMFEGSVHSSS